jgi:hypothetical protein
MAPDYRARGDLSRIAFAVLLSRLRKSVSDRMDSRRE